MESYIKKQQNKVDDQIVSSHNLEKEIKKRGKIETHKTGYVYLDKMTKGFLEGDLHIIAGLSGTGKTEFAVSLAKKFIENELNPLFFSYEITASELFERFGDPVPLFYLPKTISNEEDPSKWLEKKVVEAKEKFGVKVVFIDHLHYIVDYVTARNSNTAEMLGYLCRQLKHLARKHEVIIFLVAHVRKYDGKRPKMQDIKDGSGVYQEADSVMIIHRETASEEDLSIQEVGEDLYKVNNQAQLYLDKVRRHGSRTGKIGLIFEDGIHKEL